MDTLEYVRSPQDSAQLAASISKKALESRISQLLASATPLTLAPTHTFPSLQSLAAHLKVAAHQRSFTLEPRFNKSELRLVCTSNKSRDSKGRERYCSAYWEIECVGTIRCNSLKEGNLKVKLVRAKLTHKHSIGNVKIVEGEVDIGEESSASESSESESDDELGIVSKRGEDNVRTGESRVTPKDRAKLAREFETQDFSKVVFKEVDSKKLVFRTWKSILLDVENLRVSRPLPFPTIANKMWIADHNAFRIYCLASAAQQGITLHLSNDPTVAGPTFFRMTCQRNASSVSREDRCPYWIKIVFVEVWSPRYGWVVKEEKVHNQSCIDSRKPQKPIHSAPSSPMIVIKQDSGSPSSALNSDISSTNSTSTTTQDTSFSIRSRKSNRSSSFEGIGFLPHYKSFDTKPFSTQDIVSQPATKRPRYQIPSQNPSINYATCGTSTILPVVTIDEDTLARFLYSISPPLVFYTSLLYSNGLNSQQALLNLISMNETSFDLFLFDLEIVEKKEVIKKVQKIVFKERIGEVREILRDAEIG